MNTSVELSKEFTRERKVRGYTLKDIGELFGIATSMVSHVESGAAQFSTVEGYLGKLRELPEKPKPEKIVYTEEQLAAFREERNAAWRQYNHLNKILRYAEAGKPIDHLIQGKEDKS